MDYKKIAVTVLAGYGVYVMYQKYVSKTQNNGTGTIGGVLDCPEYVDRMPRVGVNSKPFTPIPKGCEGITQVAY